MVSAGFRITAGDLVHLLNLLFNASLADTSFVIDFMSKLFDVDWE